MNDAPIDPKTLAVLSLGHLHHAVRTKPLPTLLAAFGVGYVLGRGLPDFLLRAGSALAMRTLGDQILASGLRSIDRGNGRPRTNGRRKSEPASP